MFKFALLLIIAPLVACHHHHDHHDHSDGEKSHHEHGRHHSSPVDLTFFNATAIDAPWHCHRGWKINEIPLSNFITTGCLLDVSEKSKNAPDFLLQPEHLEEWEKNNGKFRNNTVLFVNFGWASKYPNPEFYSSYPGISEKAAEYIANTNAIVGIAVDTPDVDSTVEKPSLHVLHGANIYTVKKVALNKELRIHFYSIIVPLEYEKNADIAARVIAV